MNTLLNTLATRLGFHNQQPPFSFHGGLPLNPNKRALGESIVEPPLPPYLIIPLINYAKQSLTPTVAVGDSVRRGQLLAAGVVAPTSGKIKAIKPHATIHPDTLAVNAIVLHCDGEDKRGNPSASDNPQELGGASDNLSRLIKLRSSGKQSQMQQLVDQFALSGLGGAGFPTAEKLLGNTTPVKTLIINAAECEPEISCDEALIQSDAIDIVKGIDAAVQLSQCDQCIVAIEDSKPAAIENLQSALKDKPTAAQLMIIPTRYPTGAESPLIECVTGKYIPHNQKPTDHGVVCINIATALALWHALDNAPLDSRVLSLGGQSMPNPCNVRVRFGTTVNFILHSTGNNSVVNDHRIRAGGPLSGFDLQNLSVPITAHTNCILAEPRVEITDAQACIRCGQCADVCPARLLPQQLHWHAMADDLNGCKQFQLDACIECGCCDLVCPSSIKLTETFRYAKSQARFRDTLELKAVAAEQRFTEREHRLEQRALARKRAIEERKKTIQSSSEPDREEIKAALARARAKRQPKQSR